jgi:DsbC/DsbD-like thiol-disulfide interchange protein
MFAGSTCPRFVVGVAAVTAWILLAPDAVQAQAKKSDAYVKVVTKAEKPDADGNQVVTLTLTIDKGWHAYANPVGLEDLEDAQTRVTAVGKTQLVKVDYPAGAVHKDKVVGDYKVYEGTVAIKATVRRSSNAEPAELAIKLQVCSDKMCLPPGTLKVSIP